MRGKYQFIEENPIWVFIAIIIVICFFLIGEFVTVNRYVTVEKTYWNSYAERYHNETRWRTIYVDQCTGFGENRTCRKVPRQESYRVKVVSCEGSLTGEKLPVEFPPLVGCFDTYYNEWVEFRLIYRREEENEIRDSKATYNVWVSVYESDGDDFYVKQNLFGKIKGFADE